MFTVDAPCPRCAHKAQCKDRPEIVRTLTVLTNKLNTEEAHVDGPGDGVLVVACKDCKTA